jgi:hypothetical protein
MPARSTPFQELRFTRSRQAVTFVIAGVVFLCLAAAAMLWWFQWVERPGWLWLAALAPTLLSWACLRSAVSMTRHAYLLLSPIGIEIFPFLRPARNMQLVSWSEIAHAAVTPDHRMLELSLTGGGKIFITLAPVKRSAVPLLKKAVCGVMEKRADGESSAATA